MQRTYTLAEKSTDCVDSSHEQYDSSIDSVLARIVATDTTDPNYKPHYDLCYFEDSDGDLEYLLWVDDVGYPTCMSAPTETCPTHKQVCVEAERRNWPNTVANRLLEGRIYGANTRANHMHHSCPRILDICLYLFIFIPGIRVQIF